MELSPSKAEDTQTPFIIETLSKEIDINKVETVLDVGVGFGRIALGILETFPNVNLYDGIDFSELAIKQSEAFLDNYIVKTKKGKRANVHQGYCYMVEDFEEANIPELYDLVISCQTLSTIPDEEVVEKWVKKMVSLSKKYVVNVDYHHKSDSNIVFNIGRDYGFYYTSNLIWTFNEYNIPNYKNQKIWIARVL